jgi:hypothetical protein
MKFRICFPILQSPIIILWFLLYVFSIMLGGCSCVLFLFIKEYHLYFLNFTFCIMELKSHSPSIFIYIFLEFLYTTTLRVVLVKFFLDLGNSYLVFIVLSNAWYFNLLVSFKYCLLVEELPSRPSWLIMIFSGIDEYTISL